MVRDVISQNHMKKKTARSGANAVKLAVLGASLATVAAGAYFFF